MSHIFISHASADDPRPEKDNQGDPIPYIDHRASARPLTEAVENLGVLARLTLLTPPTYAALEQALQDAADRGKPFDVVHFDGHGVYNRQLGLGGAHDRRSGSPPLQLG